jgi:hypothetical protein
MSTQNDRDTDKMRLYVQGRSPSIDQRIEETETHLIHTREFLDRIAQSEHRTREHIARMLHHLERELQSLYAKRDSENRRQENQQEG